MSSTSLYFLFRDLTKKFFQSYFDRLDNTYTDFTRSTGYSIRLFNDTFLMVAHMLNAQRSWYYVLGSDAGACPDQMAQNGLHWCHRLQCFTKPFMLTRMSRVDRVKLSQWLYWKKNLLECSTGHILDVSVNANSFCVQCSVMALTRSWPKIEFYVIFYAK